VTGSASGVAPTTDTAVRRDSPITPVAATAPAPAARIDPSVPNRNPSPKTRIPTIAATTGFATLTIASGAASPAPRYDSCPSR
jgi:hypothetical protein